MISLIRHYPRSLIWVAITAALVVLALVTEVLTR